MRLDVEENHVEMTGVFEAANRFGADLGISIFADDPQASLLHGGEMRTAGEKGDVELRPSHLRPDVAADGATAGDEEFHVSKTMAFSGKLFVSPGARSLPESSMMPMWTPMGSIISGGRAALQERMKRRPSAPVGRSLPARESSRL